MNMKSIVEVRDSVSSAGSIREIKVFGVSVFRHSTPVVGEEKRKPIGFTPIESDGIELYNEDEAEV